MVAVVLAAVVRGLQLLLAHHEGEIVVATVVAVVLAAVVRGLQLLLAYHVVEIVPSSHSQSISSRCLARPRPVAGPVIVLAEATGRPQRPLLHPPITRPYQALLMLVSVTNPRSLIRAAAVYVTPGAAARAPVYVARLAGLAAARPRPGLSAPLRQEGGFSGDSVIPFKQRSSMLLYLIIL